MAEYLDMSLDDIISKRRAAADASRRTTSSRPRPQPRHVNTSSASHGPLRRSFWREPPRANPYPLREPRMLPSEWRNRESSSSCGTKLYISNLNYGVSNSDLELLFSEEGELLRHSVHCDKSGRSKGTAEVVFAHWEDALASIQRYNNAQLDGKPMKIDLIGADFLTPSLHVSAPSHHTGRPYQYGYPRSGQESSYVRRGQGRFHGDGARIHGYGHGHGRGRGRGRGRGFMQGHEQVRRYGEKVTVEALDADLERHIRGAKKRE